MQQSFFVELILLNNSPVDNFKTDFGLFQLMTGTIFSMTNQFLTVETTSVYNHL